MTFPRKRWILLALLAAVVAGGVVLDHPLAKWGTEKLAARVPRLRAEFRDASIGLLPPSYTIRYLTVYSRHRLSGDPLLQAESVSVRLLVAPLLRGRLVVDVATERPRVALEQPVGSIPDMPEPSDFPAAVLLRELRIEGGAVRYTWIREMNVPALAFQNIEGTLENVPTRPDLTDGPMKLDAHGTVGKSGHMSISAEAESFDTPLTFSGVTKVSGFDPSEMNKLVADQKGVILKPGSFSMTMTFRSADGKVTGQVDPVLEGSGIASAGQGALDGIGAALAKVSMSFASPADGTDRAGAIAVRDNVSQSDRQLLATMEKVVENGFLLGLQEGMKRAEGGGAQKGEESKEQKATPLKTGK